MYCFIPIDFAAAVAAFTKADSARACSQNRMRMFASKRMKILMLSCDGIHTLSQECYVNASVVAAYLATNARVPPATPLYLIGGNVSDTDVQAFQAQGYNNVHRGIPGAAVFGPSDLLPVSYLSCHTPLSLTERDDTGCVVKKH
jgi:hypothetical protein